MDGAKNETVRSSASVSWQPGHARPASAGLLRMKRNCSVAKSAYCTSSAGSSSWSICVCSGLPVSIGTLTKPSGTGNVQSTATHETLVPAATPPAMSVSAAPATPGPAKIAKLERKLAHAKSSDSARSGVTLMRPQTTSTRRVSSAATSGPKKTSPGSGATSTNSTAIGVS